MKIKNIHLLLVSLVFNSLETMESSPNDSDKIQQDENCNDRFGAQSEPKNHDNSYSDLGTQEGADHDKIYKFRDFDPHDDSNPNDALIQMMTLIQNMKKKKRQN
jgi:hypothetical protein